MSEQYNHAIAADWRQRAAMASADKVGGAFTGWRPEGQRKRSSWLLVLLCAALTALAVRYL